MKYQILFKKLRDDAIIPVRVTEGSAAYDAKLPSDYELKYGRQIVKLGFALSMSKEIALDDRTRAGYAAKGLLCYDEDDNEYRIDADVILGLIDSDYRDEVGVILHVKDEIVKTKKLFLKRDQAISQLNFIFVPQTEFIVVDELDETDRIGGFGKQNGE